MTLITFVAGFVVGAVVMASVIVWRCFGVIGREYDTSNKQH
jgi:hypothetical protein